MHPSAVLIGDVIVGAGCYIGPFASLRGDFGGIRVHAGANIQDSCIMHGFPGTDTVVEEDGHIGHAAVLHSCMVGKNALVGMNAVVNDNAVIGEGAIVAAMAFVKAGTVVPPRSLVAGHPGARRAHGDGAGARVEALGDGVLPGAHAPLPRDDAGDGAARRPGAEATSLPARRGRAAPRLQGARHLTAAAAGQKPAAWPSRRGSDAGDVAVARCGR